MDQQIVGECVYIILADHNCSKENPLNRLGNYLRPPMIGILVKSLLGQSLLICQYNCYI